MSRAQQAADAIAALSGASPDEIARTLREFDTRDIVAAAIWGGVLLTPALDDLTDVDTAGGAEGDVLTQQNDGSFALEASGGGSQAGILTSADLLFTEVAGSATYSASLPVLAGTVVADIILYPLVTPWAADFPAPLKIGDTANGVDAYFSMDANSLNANYDPTNPSTAANWTDLANSGNVYTHVPWNALAADGPNGPGIRYAADDTITLSVVTTNAVPVSPTGVLLVKIVYFAPVTASAAVVT